jgi:thioredoxin reductase (NADPH)
MNKEIRNVVIIGSGPGAYTAGFYSATANLKPLILETKTTDTCKFNGFNKVAGVINIKTPEEFIELTREQAKRFDVEFSNETVTEIYPGDLIKIITSSGIIITKACIIDDKIIASSLLNEEMLNEDGLINCKEKRSITLLPGIFACGGAREKHREAVIYASSGCMAALDAKEYIEKCSV